LNNQYFSPRKIKTSLFLLGFGTLLLGWCLGIATSYLLGLNRTETYSYLREEGYKYINPLIDFDRTDFMRTKEQKELETKLVTFIEKETENSANVIHISTYYKDLNTGGWIGINEDEKFTMASLGKIAVMMAHYRITETNPEHLEQSFIYRFDAEAYPEIYDNRTDGNSLQEGTAYTLDEYINQLIIYSDNTVLPFLIREEAHIREINEIFSSLGIENPFDSYENNFITAKDYATFFRILYNATYLNKEMSSKALELLSQVYYNEGLAKGIPQHIVVANKFGELTSKASKGEVIEELHDCGIIYHPSRPYILCVMTKGSNKEDLQKAISAISNIVYQSVDSTEMSSKEIRDLLQKK
jgi:beta-lactamase class A